MTSAFLDSHTKLIAGSDVSSPFNAYEKNMDFLSYRIMGQRDLTTVYIHYFMENTLSLCLSHPDPHLRFE